MTKLGFVEVLDISLRPPLTRGLSRKQRDWGRDATTPPVKIFDFDHLP